MLTCGIAHEFNNLLTPIMGYSGMLLEQKKPEDPEYDEVKEIFTASEKARDVIHQISSFGRKNSEPFKPVELKQLTGYVHGGTSPLGMINQYRVIFDECAGDMDKVVINGGGGGYLVELSLDEFAKVQPYELMPLKK